MAVIEQEVSSPQKVILRSRAWINLFLAGVGSGKTHLAGIISYCNIRKFSKIRGFIGANTYEQLNNSTMFRIREYWKSIGLTEWSKENPNGLYVVGKQPPPHFKRDGHNFDRYDSIVSFINGGIAFMGALENAKTHEGKEFGWAILDETKDTRESDVKEIILARLRQKGMFNEQGEEWNPLYILTSPAKVDWINEMFELEKSIDEISAKIFSDKTFFQKEFGGKLVTISSTYHNQKNLPANYIQNVLDNNTEERGKALIYGHPFVSTGGEFYSSFDRLKHVKTFKYDPSLPLHLSFDQNSVPYNSCGISQVVNVNGIWECRFIDEIALENPRNSTEEVCEEFMMRYPNHKAGLYYYGDASGHNRTTMNKDFKHHYEVIDFKLRKYMNNGSDRTLISNPSVVRCRDFINLIFEDKLPVRIYFDESCKKMIADMMYTKQALDGTKDKHIVTDKDTGDKYQKYGHFTDLLTYKCVELFKNFYNG